MLISFLHNDISRFKVEDQEKIEEYLKTNKNFQNLCSAVNEFRDIFRIKDDSSLKTSWIKSRSPISVS